MRSKTRTIATWIAAAALVACATPGQIVVAGEEKGQLDEVADKAPSDAAHTPGTSAVDLPEALRAQATRGPSGDTSDAYVDPEKARELSERIHEKVRDAAAIGGSRPR